MKILNALFYMCIGVLISAYIQHYEAKAQTIAKIPELEEQVEISGMYFNTKYVVEEYEYDDAYAIVYNDPDANIVNQEILVDEETYWTCIEATEKGEELSGILIVNWFDSCPCVKIYGFISDEDIID